MKLSKGEIQILILASNIAAIGYTSENKGLLEIREKNITTFTPTNIKSIYDELINLLQNK